jgi:hypothetical protein
MTAEDETVKRDSVHAVIRTRGGLENWPVEPEARLAYEEAHVTDEQKLINNPVAGEGVFHTH